MNNKLKILPYLFLFLFILGHPVQIYSEQLINVGVYEFKPLIFRNENQKPSGLFIDVLEHVAEKEGWKLNYISGTWNEVYMGLLDGKIDLLPCIGITEARKELVDFADSYIFLDWGVIYSLPGSGIDSIFDLKNKKIAVVKSSVYTEGLKQLSARFDINSKYIEVDTYTNVFTLIEEHKADAGISSNMTGIQYENRFSARRTSVVFSPVKITFAVKKGQNSKVIGTINSDIASLKEDRSSIYYHRYNYWIRGISEEGLPSFVWKIGAGFLVLGLFLLIWNYILKLQVNRATGKIIQRESELRESELHFRTLSDSGQALIWTSGTYKKCDYFNQPWLDFTGRTLEQEVGDGWVEGVHPDDLERCVKIYSDAFDRRVKFSMAYRLRHSDGGYRWIQDDGTPRYNSDGEFIGYIGHCLDITERKDAEKNIQNLLREKELLLQEVHNRIKNNMNTIKGLLTLQLNSEENQRAKASLSDAESRVQSMIMLYDRLYCTDNYREMSVKDYLQPLAENIIAGFPNSSIIKIETEIEDFILNVTLLAPLGIIINELLTNMMKYAFSGRESGIISLSAGIQDNHVKVTVCDNGIGIPESVSFNHTTGFGLDLVGMLTEQIGGTISIERGSGTKFILEFDV